MNNTGFYTNGIVSPQERHQIEQFRSFFTLDDRCGQVSTKVANLLEKGGILDPSFNENGATLFENVQDNSDTLFTDPPLLQNGVRICRVFENSTKKSLEEVLKQLGPKSHALIKSDYKLLPFGHAWNYAYQLDGTYKILDGYSKMLYSMGSQHPKTYFNLFKKKF